MQADLEKLIRAVVESPDDDSPRLAFADAIDQAGQPGRAEFIRVQCECASLGYGHARAAELELRARELLKGNESAWSGAPSLTFGATPFYWRGFISSLTLAQHARPDLEAYDPIWASNPVTALRVDSAWLAAELMCRPGLARLHTLTVAGQRLASSEPFDELFDDRGPLLPALRKLVFFGVNWAESTLAALANTRRLPALEALTLNLVSTTELQALVSGASLRSLKELTLDIGGGGKDADAMLGLLGSAAWNASLEVLSLKALISKLGGAALAAGGPYPLLRELSLAGSPVEQPGLTALVKTKRMPALSRLSLSRTGATSSTIRALAAGPLFAKLTRLDLSQNKRLDDKALEPLLSSPCDLVLESLTLRETPVSLAGYHALTRRLGPIVEGLDERALEKTAALVSKSAVAKGNPPPKAQGVKFADDNLRLIVIDALRERGLLPGFDRETFYRVELGKKKVPEPKQAVDKHVLSHLLATAIAPELACKLEELVWDGGQDVFQDVWPEWDGEDQTFSLRSLAGIEGLTSLKKLVILNGNLIADWAPLGLSSSLERLVVAGGEVKLEPLRAAPALRSLELTDVVGREQPANSAALTALEQRGVKVSWT